MMTGVRMRMFFNIVSEMKSGPFGAARMEGRGYLDYEVPAGIDPFIDIFVEGQVFNETLRPDRESAELNLYTGRIHVDAVTDPEPYDLTDGVDGNYEDSEDAFSSMCYQFDDFRSAGVVIDEIDITRLELLRYAETQFPGSIELALLGRDGRVWEWMDGDYVGRDDSEGQR